LPVRHLERVCHHEGTSNYCASPSKGPLQAACKAMGADGDQLRQRFDESGPEPVPESRRFDAATVSGSAGGRIRWYRSRINLVWVSGDSTRISITVGVCRAASGNSANRDGTRAARIIALLFNIPRIMPPRPTTEKIGLLSPAPSGSTALSRPRIAPPLA
ncbi:MAG: hypothetical protein R6U98_11920, partial [Pirellulaceae bacterium]